jgi:glutamine synthetase
MSLQCLKELADSMGVSVTFMAKPDAAQPGSSCHIHLSLWEDGRNIFSGEKLLGSTKCRYKFTLFEAYKLSN